MDGGGGVCCVCDRVAEASAFVPMQFLGCIFGIESRTDKTIRFSQGQVGPHRQCQADSKVPPHLLGQVEPCRSVKFCLGWYGGAQTSGAASTHMADVPSFSVRIV